MTDIAIRVENLGKRYQLGAPKSGSFRESLSHLFKTENGPGRRAERKTENGKNDPVSVLRSPSSVHPSHSESPPTPNSQSPIPTDFWALQDINFEIKRGEAVGIIGRNGAGKSTLLKILSRITEPTKGRFEIFGRVSSLLEVGTGFHPELTGRENVYLNGTILGMKRREVKAKFDEIVAFSGVEKFIDTPVKHYSSGMQVRLAFAVAAHLEPEILIIDEVLAVGDAEFQKKCLGKMEDVTGEGRTVLFVSHNMGAVRRICPRSILLIGGKVNYIGETELVTENYLRESKEQENVSLRDRVDRKGSGKVVLTDISLVQNSSKDAVVTVISGTEVSIKINYESTDTYREKIKDFHIGLAVYDGQQRFVTAFNNKMANFYFRDIPPKGCVYCKLERFPLIYGSFSIMASLVVDHELTDRVNNALIFHVEEGDFYNSGLSNAQRRQGVYVDQKWEF